jgi:hypothetical protein
MLQNAPDVWEILRALAGDNPWLILLVAALSWIAMLYGVYKTSTRGVGHANELVRRLLRRQRRGEVITRFVAAFLLALIPAGWLITAIPWGNVMLYMIAGGNVNWFDMTVGSVVYFVYTTLAGAGITAAYLTESPAAGLRYALAAVLLPGIPVLILTLMVGEEPGSFWVVFSGFTFVLGYFLAPLIVIGCIRLCTVRILA